MLHTRFAIVWLALLFGGCATSEVISDAAVKSAKQPAIFAKLDAVDSIQIDELTLNDPEEVRRFIQVCRNAAWGPYIATLPAETNTVTLKSGGVETHRLLQVGGWLLDITGDGVPHFGTIQDEDTTWIREHIDNKLTKLRNTR